MFQTGLVSLHVDFLVQKNNGKIFLFSSGNGMELE